MDLPKFVNSLQSTGLNVLIVMLYCYRLVSESVIPFERAMIYEKRNTRLLPTLHLLILPLEKRYAILKRLLKNTNVTFTTNRQVRRYIKIVEEGYYVYLLSFGFVIIFFKRFSIKRLVKIVEPFSNDIKEVPLVSQILNSWF